MQHSKNLIKIIITLITAITTLRLVSLGLYPLFDPTEGRYAEIGRKMLETGNFVTPFIEYNVPFWAKPPLSFWLTAFSYKIFGVNEFAARLPSFFSMAGVAYLVWGVAKRISNSGQAWMGVLILSSMVLFFYLAGAVMTDPILAFGISLTMVSFWRAVMWQEKLWAAGFFAGVVVAMLAKGPIGVVLMGMPILVWAVSQRYKLKIIWQNLPWVYGTLLTIILVVPWYIWAEIRTPGFLHYFVIGEHFERFLNPGWKGDLYGSGRAHPVGTIWLFALLAMAPWSLLLLASLFVKIIRQKFVAEFIANKEWQVYLLLWALLPLLFFTFARNVLITYVASSLPAFALLLAPIVSFMLHKLHGRVCIIIMAIFVPVLAAVILIVVNVVPDANWIKSEKQIINEYKNLTKNHDVPLIYIGKHSYSEDFYLGKEDIEVADVSNLRAYLDREFFVVMSRLSYERINADLKKILALVAHKNNSVLLHYAPPSLR